VLIDFIDVVREVIKEIYNDKYDEELLAHPEDFELIS